MPLNDPKLLLDLEGLYDFMGQQTDEATSKREYTTRLKTIISDYVRSALVTTTGTAAAQTGTLS